MSSIKCYDFPCFQISIFIECMYYKAHFFPWKFTKKIYFLKLLNKISGTKNLWLNILNMSTKNIFSLIWWWNLYRIKESSLENEKFQWNLVLFQSIFVINPKELFSIHGSFGQEHLKLFKFLTILNLMILFLRFHHWIIK